MIKIKIFLIAILFSLAGACLAETTPSIDAPDQRKVYGVIASIEQVPTSSSASDQGRDWMGSMYGVLGLLITDLLSTTHRGHLIYHVKVNDDIQLEVGSRESFNVGDCVDVWYPDKMGDTPNLSLLGDAGIAKSTACNTQ